MLRSSKDFATRLIVTFGYFASNASLSSVICAAWPPRTSWSHTVSVTSPAFDGSGLVTVCAASFLFFSAALSLPPPR